VGCELGVQVVAGASTWIGEAYVSAKLGGYMEASGDRGAECFKLMMLSVYQQVRDVSDWAADRLMDPSDVEAIVADMDEDDQVASGMEIELEAGFEAPKIGDLEQGASAEGELRLGTLLENEGGQLVAHDVSNQTYTLAVDLGFMECEASLAIEQQDGAWHSTEVTLEASKDLTWDEMTLLMGASATISGLIADLAGVVDGKSGLVQDGETARQIGATADLIKDCSGLGLGTVWGTQKALEGIKGFQGATVGHKLSVSVESESGKRTTFELRLDRTTGFEIGDAQAVGAHVEFESAEEVFSISTTRAAGTAAGVGAGAGVEGCAR
jgi:hypothetical protein